MSGDVHVQGHLNEVSVADVKGALQLDGEFQESIKLERIAKTVTFKSSRTDMELSRISGSLDLDSDDLHAEDIAGPVHLTTRSKNIRLEDVSGDVRLQDDNGAVELIMRSRGKRPDRQSQRRRSVKRTGQSGIPTGCAHTRWRDSV